MTSVSINSGSAGGAEVSPYSSVSCQYEPACTCVVPPDTAELVKAGLSSSEVVELWKEYYGVVARANASRENGRQLASMTVGRVDATIEDLPALRERTDERARSCGAEVPVDAVVGRCHGMSGASRKLRGEGTGGRSPEFDSWDGEEDVGVFTGVGTGSVSSPSELADYLHGVLGAESSVPVRDEDDEDEWCYGTDGTSGDEGFGSLCGSNSVILGVRPSPGACPGRKRKTRKGVSKFAPPEVDAEARKRAVSEPFRLPNGSSFWPHGGIERVLDKSQAATVMRQLGDGCRFRSLVSMGPGVLRSLAELAHVPVLVEQGRCVVVPKGLPSPPGAIGFLTLVKSVPLAEMPASWKWALHGHRRCGIREVASSSFRIA